MRTSEVFAKAALLDNLVTPTNADIERLDKIRIYPERYSRKKLFQNMTNGKVGLYYSLPIYAKKGNVKSEGIVSLVKNGFGRATRTKTQNGPSRTRKTVTVSELMDKWERRKGIISVTDLHFRGTRFEKNLEADVLSDFNVYCSNDTLIEHLEMMTAVISTKGNVTDSHSDDSDGSNHCFCGQKLWLVWDRLEGKKAGLEDCTFDYITTHAKFSIKNFLKIPSAQWFVIQEGETLFLPGNLTHRVITLENYIGVGSFHAALPSYILSLRRWVLTGSTDVTPELLEIINKEIIACIRKIKAASKGDKEVFGLEYVKKSVDNWQQHENQTNKERMMKNTLVCDYLNAVAEI